MRGITETERKLKGIILINITPITFKEVPYDQN